MPLFDDLLKDIESLSGETATDKEIRKIMESLMIRPKVGGSYIPFRFNKMQEDFWNIRTRRSWFLKARQLGASTLSLAEFFARAITLPNENCVVYCHTREAAERLFNVIKAFYNHLPDSKKRELNNGPLTPAAASRREFHFVGNGSRIFVGTAGSPEAIRGTTLTAVLLSEAAFYDDFEAVMSAVLAACVPTAVVRIETTANIGASAAYVSWKEAEARDSNFTAYFYPWWWDDGYAQDPPTDEASYTEEERALAARAELDSRQVAWRRWAQKEQRGNYRREYAEDPETCWTFSGDLVFSLDRVLSCWDPMVRNPMEFSSQDLLPGERWLMQPQQGHSFVIGADPAEGVEGGDFSAIQAFDRETGDQVYSAHVRIPLYQFSRLLDNLGRQLGGALLCVLSNNHGHAVLQTLDYELDYPNLYYDDKGRPGIQESEREKTLLIGELDKAFWEHSLMLRDHATFSMLRSYVYDERRHAGASAGAHDDLVAALLCVNRGLGSGSGGIMIGDLAYPLPDHQAVGRAARENAGLSIGDVPAWFKTDQGPMPFHPDALMPQAPTYAARRVWSCPSCGAHEIGVAGWNRDTGKLVSVCGHCHVPVDADPLYPVVY